MCFDMNANTKNAFTRTALKQRFEKIEAIRALKRVFVLSLLLFGMWFNELMHNICLQMIFIALGICCLINIASFVLISFEFFMKKPLYGTERQRNLLNLNETIPQIEAFPEVHEKPKEHDFQIVAFTPSNKHHQQPFLSSTPKKSYAGKTQKELKRKPQQHDFIADENSLKAYLKAYGNMEEIDQVDFNSPQLSNAHAHAAKLLQTSVYQLAADSKQQNPPLINNYTNNLQTEMLAHLSFEQLTQFVLNLRHWISITILKPLIKEIDEINVIFERVYLSEFKIGITGLEYLRSLVVQTQFVSEHVRRLPMIMPYLEICANQIYLLERLRSLANGAWLDSYTCRMVSTFHFSSLPNDVSIIFQCLCNYFDRQLLPLGQDDIMSERLFFDKYVILNDGQHAEKQLHTLIRNQTGCALLCTDLIRPKFNLITNDKLYYGQYGFNNLFHVFLGFLTYIKRNNNGMLEGVSLGVNGINILRVIGEME